MIKIQLLCFPLQNIGIRRRPAASKIPEPILNWEETGIGRPGQSGWLWRRKPVEWWRFIHRPIWWREEARLGLRRCWGWPKCIHVHLRTRLAQVSFRWSSKEHLLITGYYFTILTIGFTDTRICRFSISFAKWLSTSVKFLYPLNYSGFCPKFN